MLHYIYMTGYRLDLSSKPFDMSPSQKQCLVGPSNALDVYELLAVSIEERPPSKL